MSSILPLVLSLSLISVFIVIPVTSDSGGGGGTPGNCITQCPTTTCPTACDRAKCITIGLFPAESVELAGIRCKREEAVKFKDLIGALDQHKKLQSDVVQAARPFTDRATQRLNTMKDKYFEIKRAAAEKATLESEKAAWESKRVALDGQMSRLQTENDGLIAKVNSHEQLELQALFTDLKGMFPSLLFSMIEKDPTICSSTTFVPTTMPPELNGYVTLPLYQSIYTAFRELSKNVVLPPEEIDVIRDALVSGRLDSKTCEMTVNSSSDQLVLKALEYLGEIQPLLLGPWMHETACNVARLSRSLPIARDVNMDVKQYIDAEIVRHVVAEPHIFALKYPEEIFQDIVDHLSTDAKFYKLKMVLGERYSEAQTRCLVRKEILIKLSEIVRPRGMSNLTIVVISAVVCLMALVIAIILRVQLR